MTDGDRSAVYATEQTLRAMLDTADATDVRTIDFYGSKLELPIVRRFGDIASIQRYCDRICELEGASPVTVRQRRGSRAAHYERLGAVIAIPDDRWARTEIVVLHELAHHLARGDGHGERFRGMFILLVREYIGHEVALLLESGFHMNLAASA